MSRRVVNERGRPIGESHHRAKLSEAQVAELIALREQGLFFRVLAERFNVSETAVKDICSGRRRAQLAAVDAPWEPSRGDAPRWTFGPLQRAWGGP